MRGGIFDASSETDISPSPTEVLACAYVFLLECHIPLRRSFTIGFSYTPYSAAFIVVERYHFVRNSKSHCHSLHLFPLVLFVYSSLPVNI